MNKKKVDEILNIINLNLPNIEISRNHFGDDLSVLGLDSLTFIQIVVELEDKFSCEIPDSKLILSEMNTVNKIITVLDGLEKKYD